MAIMRGEGKMRSLGIAPGKTEEEERARQNQLYSTEFGKYPAMEVIEQAMENLKKQNASELDEKQRNPTYAPQLLEEKIYLSTKYVEPSI